MAAVGAVSDKRAKFVPSCKSGNFSPTCAFFRFTHYVFLTDVENGGPSRKTDEAEVVHSHDVKYKDGGEAKLTAGPLID
jgi:hypothetical protein